MIEDPIVEELHRHREELFQELGNDPEALVRHLQEKERSSNRIIQPPPPPRSETRRARMARR